MSVTSVELKTDKTKKEEPKQPDKIDKMTKFKIALPQILATSAKNLLLTGYGMTLGFPTIVIPSLEPGTSEKLTLTEDQISWFSSINLICVPLGCLLSGSITQALGRKRTMMLVNIPFLVAWIVFHFANSVGMLYTSLILAGLGGGLMEAPVLTYVAEITQPHLRGMLSATASMCVILGVFIQFVLGNFMTWRSIALVNLAFPLVAAFALCFVPESPYWLIIKGRIEEAEKSLCWLRGWVQPENVKTEFESLLGSLTSKKEENEKNENNTKNSTKKNGEICGFAWRNYCKKTFWKPYIIVTAGFFFGHFAGMTTLQTFAVKIFATLGTPINKFMATMYLGLVELAGTLVCVVLVHWTGKRPLTFFSTIGNGVCFIIVATYTYLLKGDTEAIPKNPYSWVPLTFLVAAAFMSHVGIRLLPWILIGEVYPSEVRGVASGASGSIGYILGFAANKVYYSMIHSFTMAGTFWFYGVISIIGFVFFYFLLPETEGRTLQEIEEHFAGTRNLVKERKVKHKKQKHESSKWAVSNPALVKDEEESHI